MSKSDLIERLNVLHLQRAVVFNNATPAEQLRLAQDPSFWRVPNCCVEFTWDGVCLECGCSTRSFDRLRRVAPFRGAVVSP